MINKILAGISPLYGVCSFDDIKDYLLDCRAKSRLPENAKSVVMIAFPYLLPDEYYDGLNVSKYAAIPDYHLVVTPKLQSACEELKKAYPGNSFEFFADNSPIPEVYAAVKAGIGVKGYNSLLLTREYGSFVFLGEIVTDMYITPSSPMGSFCEGCMKCVSACPVSAIDKGIIDRSKCLSAISQKKGDLTEEEQKLIKDSGCAWGCDICQNICPHNKNAKTTPYREFLEGAIANVPQNPSVEGRAFAWRGDKVIARNLKILENED